LGSTLQGQNCHTLASSYSSDIHSIWGAGGGGRSPDIHNPHVGYVMLVMLGQLHPAAKSLSTGEG